MTATTRKAAPKATAKAAPAPAKTTKAPAPVSTKATPAKAKAAPAKAPAPAATPAKRAPRKSGATRIEGAVAIVVSDEQRYRMIAEAAYFRAESNQFQSDSVRDWIEAEKDIAALLNGQR